MSRVLRWVGRTGRQLLLTTGALLGVACLLGTVAAPLVGVRPLVFLSGSMSPTIPAGSLAFARETPAAQVRVGDVVTVAVAEGFLTHRVVEASHSDGTATLRLQGDGNDEPDPTVHQVRSVPRVLAFVPHAGSVVAWLSRAPGVYVLAAYVVVALALLRRRRDELDRLGNDSAEQDGEGGPGPDRRGGRPRSRVRWARARGVAVLAQTTDSRLRSRPRTGVAGGVVVSSWCLR